VHPGIHISGYLKRAVPDARVVREIRAGKGKMRIWAHTNHDHWEQSATADEIRDALKN
jgi:hypothetical protein